MYLSRTTTKIIVIVIFIVLSGYSSLQDGINQDPPPESFIQSKTNWFKTLFARIPNLDFGVRGHDEPPIITGEKIIDKGQKVKEAVTMTFSDGVMTTLEETAKSAAETTKDKIHQTVVNVKDTIYPPHDDHKHDEPNHEL
ncbi:hypothetical protein CTI12_AA416610 [Artemisia annua]|uniref:Uncharacterized protein n=1 Tax=Artemisia annua TaxID=35608 RepID=A0A2U1M6G5_ARTAN|nr:hypothetical protein CTI12_AA416610 [Artemisia annua]